MENEQSKNWVKSKFVKIGIYILAGLIVLGLAGSSFYFYRQYKQASVAPPPQDTRDELTKLTDEIKVFMELPDELPTLATVTDAEQAKSQPFLSRAENGDKVLIYMQAKKAILYRPSARKIIEVATISSVPEDNANADAEPPAADAENENQEVAGEENTQAQEPAEPETPVRVAVYNGSNIKGLAAALAGKIDDLENVKIAKIANAKGSYDVTFVADLNGKNAELCEKIAQEIDGQVGVFPEDEEMPEADILVIGGDKQ